MKYFSLLLIMVLPIASFAATLTATVNNETGNKVYYYQAEPNPVGTIEQSPACKSDQKNHLCLIPGKTVLTFKPAANGHILNELIAWTVRKTGSGSAHFIFDSSGHDCFQQGASLRTVCLIAHNGTDMKTSMDPKTVDWDAKSDQAINITISK